MNNVDRCKTRELQTIIASEFPACAYHGKVMTTTHAPSEYEIETDNLDVVLAGKTWKEIGAEFVAVNRDDYVLMNDSAVVAFLGAWLWSAVENLDGKNQVRSSLIFHLATFGGVGSAGSGLWANNFKSLSQKQRLVIHRILECAAESAEEKERDQISKALKNVEANASSD